MKIYGNPGTLADLEPCTQTRVYEKIRFARTRQSQTAGVDLRDRWHNALKNLDEGVEVDPESVKMRNRWLYAYDAEADAVERWEEVSAQVAKELQANQIIPLCDAMPQRSSRTHGEMKGGYYGRHPVIQAEA